MKDILLVLAPYLVPFVIGGVFYLVRAGLSRQPQSQVGLVQHFVEAAVLAVEQAHPELAGPDKKAAALGTIQSLLATAHIKASPVLVDTLIEAACASLSHSESPPSAGFGFGR